MRTTRIQCPSCGATNNAKASRCRACGDSVRTRSRFLVILAALASIVVVCIVALCILLGTRSPSDGRASVGASGQSPTAVERDDLVAAIESSKMITAIDVAKQTAWVNIKEWQSLDKSEKERLVKDISLYMTLKGTPAEALLRSHSDETLLAKQVGGTVFVFK